MGQSRVLSLTIFVPVLGYMILFNEQLVHYFELSREILFPSQRHGAMDEISDEVSADNVTRLFFFYFGFTFLGLGSLLYQLTCPALIKEHGSDREYIREEIDLMTPRRVQLTLAYMDQMGQGDPIELSDIGERYNGDNVGLMLNGTERERTQRAAVTDLMQHQWQTENWSAAHVRLAISTFYGFGFITLAIPSVEMFVRVSYAFISNV